MFFFRPTRLTRAKQECCLCCFYLALLPGSLVRACNKASRESTGQPNAKANCVASDVSVSQVMALSIYNAMGVKLDTLECTAGQDIYVVLDATISASETTSGGKRDTTWVSRRGNVLALFGSHSTTGIFVNPNGDSAENGTSCFRYYIPVGPTGPSGSTGPVGACTLATCPEDVCRDIVSTTPVEYVLAYQPTCQYNPNSTCNSPATVATSRVLVKCEAAPVRLLPRDLVYFDSDA